MLDSVNGPATQPESAVRIGRYLISAPIASGGMATVHFGALVGEAGFSRVVAIKRVHTGKRKRSLIQGLLDEAHLVSRIQHPNVVPTLDLVATEAEVLVVLAYVVGESLSRLLRALDQNEEQMPIEIATTIATSVLHGLHAAHDAKSATGRPLAIVHRDVSPQNVMVGVDGHARVLDFGIAKATERLNKSHAGQVKGKLAYMAPEQLRSESDRRTDIYAVGVVLWESLTGRRLFSAKTPGDLMALKLDNEVEAPSTHRPDIPEELERIVMKALSKDPDERFSTARHMATALEACVPVAPASVIGQFVQQVAGPSLAQRANIVAALEAQAAGMSGETPDIVLPSSAEEVFTEEVPSLEAARGRATTREPSMDRDRAVETSPEPTVPAPTAEPAAEVARVMGGATLVSAETETKTSVRAEDSTPPPPLPVKRMNPMPWLAAAVLIVAAIALHRTYFAESAPPATASAPVADQVTAAPTPSPPPPPAATPAETAPRPTPAPLPIAATVASPSGALPKPAKAPPPPPAPTVNCNPPYTVNANSVKVPKPECFK